MSDRFALSPRVPESAVHTGADGGRAGGLRSIFDRLGLGLAGLCAVHCLLAIALVGGLGIGGHLLLDPEIHRVGLVLAVLVAAVAIGRGALVHRRAGPFVVAMTGLTFMGGALAVGHGTDEFVLTLIGVVLVALGHLLNLRAAHRSGHARNRRPPN